MKHPYKFLMEFESQIPRLQCFLQTEEDRRDFYNSAQGAMVTIDVMTEYTKYVLKYIFEDGLGNIDENSSKDDLVDEYKRILEILNN